MRASSLIKKIVLFIWATLSFYGCINLLSPSSITSVEEFYSWIDEERDLDVELKKGEHLVFFEHSYFLKRLDSTFVLKGIGYFKSSDGRKSGLGAHSVRLDEISSWNQVDWSFYEWQAALVGIPVIGLLVYITIWVVTHFPLFGWSH